MDATEFPYIKSLLINDCYAYQNLQIDTNPQEKPFQHIILTGKNGSGKSTILSRVNLLLYSIKNGIYDTFSIEVERYKNNILKYPHFSNVSTWKEELKKLTDIEILFQKDKNDLKMNQNSILSFFQANRKTTLNEVNSVTQETVFFQQLNQNDEHQTFIQSFKQYLVNKKVYQALDLIKKNSDNKISQETDYFFEQLTDTFRKIFHDENLILEFEDLIFEFYLKLSDERKITFNELSDGFSAFLSILMDLFMRVDLIRKTEGDFNYNPPGFVLIDEPETHLHLEMQYEILPLLANLFPNIQFIVATHSPAVISSLKNAVVYDLSTQSQIADKVLGSSYSELMVSHFGLDNEFSGVADKILQDAKNAIINNDTEALQKVLVENEKYLTPILRLELESQLITLKAKKMSV